MLYQICFQTQFGSNQQFCPNTAAASLYQLAVSYFTGDDGAGSYVVATWNIKPRSSYALHRKRLLPHYEMMARSIDF